MCNECLCHTNVEGWTALEQRYHVLHFNSQKCISWLISIFGFQIDTCTIEDIGGIVGPNHVGGQKGEDGKIDYAVLRAKDRTVTRWTIIVLQCVNWSSASACPTTNSSGAVHNQYSIRFELKCQRR